MLLYVAIVEEMRPRSDDLTSMVMKPALTEGVLSFVPLTLMLNFRDYVAVLSYLVGAAMGVEAL